MVVFVKTVQIWQTFLLVFWWGNCYLAITSYHACAYHPKIPVQNVQTITMTSKSIKFDNCRISSIGAIFYNRNLTMTACNYRKKGRKQDELVLGSKIEEAGNRKTTENKYFGFILWPILSNALAFYSHLQFLMHYALCTFLVQMNFRYSSALDFFTLCTR